MTEAQRGLVAFWLLFLRAPHRWRLDYGAACKASLLWLVTGSDGRNFPGLASDCKLPVTSWCEPLSNVYHHDISQLSYWSSIHSSWFVWSFCEAVELMRKVGTESNGRTNC